jgi:hypothetical protein
MMMIIQGRVLNGELQSKFSMLLSELIASEKEY